MKRFLVILLFVTHLLMSYGGSIWPLRAIIGSVLIAIIARAAWPAHWKDWLGLRIPLRDGLWAIAMAPLMMALLYLLVKTIANAQHIFFQPAWIRYGVFDTAYLHTLGQTLNEELLFGALILNALQLKFNKSHPLLIAAAVAAMFSLLHYTFYRWIVLPGYSGILAPGTLFVLFTIGMCRNTLILQSKHIAYAWSLHFSINCVGLIGLYRFANGGKLTEPEVFNFILGSQATLILSLVILVAMCLYWLYRIYSTRAARLQNDC
jgi:membrane protease YdiL (CAAX protease family)